MGGDRTAEIVREQAAKHGTARGTPRNGERSVLIETLAKHRTLFRRTLDGVSEDDARRRTTVSELTLGGLLKHAVEVEEVWTEFVRTGEVRGSEEWGKFTPEAVAAGEEPAREDFVLRDDETVTGLLARWDEIAARTDELVASADLDVTHLLPDAPWNPPGMRWSARHALAHVVGETAQHSGHADIVREALDGQRTMG